MTPNLPLNTTEIKDSIFNFAGFSADKRLVIWTTTMIIFLAFGGYVLWKQHLKDDANVVTSKDNEIKRLLQRNIILEAKFDRATDKLNHYLENDKLERDSLKADNKKIIKLLKQ